MRSAKKVRSWVVAIAAAVALVAVQAAIAELPVIRFNPADQAAAKAAVLKLADLGEGWKGGPKKPNLAEDNTCREWKPKQSDLVLTGAAESAFGSQTLGIWSGAHVLKTRRMVELDWQRTALDPRLVTCLKRASEVEDVATVVSAKRLPFAKLVPQTTRVRLVLEYATANGKLRMLMDMIFIAKGRTELTLMLVAPYAQRATAEAAEVRLARIMLGRARA